MFVVFAWLSLSSGSRRAPLCYRPGSHRTIAARNSAHNIDIAGLEQKHGSLQELLDGGTKVGHLSLGLL